MSGIIFGVNARKHPGVNEYWPSDWLIMTDLDCQNLRYAMGCRFQGFVFFSENRVPPSGYVKIAIENGPSIVDLPIENCGFFYSFVAVYQRVPQNLRTNHHCSRLNYNFQVSAIFRQTHRSNTIFLWLKPKETYMTLECKHVYVCVYI